MKKTRPKKSLEQLRIEAAHRRRLDTDFLDATAKDPPTPTKGSPVLTIAQIVESRKRARAASIAASSRPHRSMARLAGAPDSSAPPATSPDSSAPPATSPDSPTVGAPTLAAIGGLFGLGKDATADDIAQAYTALPDDSKALVKGALGLDASASDDDVIGAIAALEADSVSDGDEIAAKLCSPRELALCREMALAPHAYVTARWERDQARRLGVRLSAPKDFGVKDAPKYDGWSDGKGPFKGPSDPKAKPLQTSPVKRPARIVEGTAEAHGLKQADLDRAAELGVAPKDFAARKAAREAQSRPNHH